MSKPTPTVAIITRTKDRPLLLERAIKSIHNQTFTDFVHVIINDAGSKEVVDELIESYSALTKGRVVVIHNEESKGMEAASNKAIKSVDSVYVAIHDDDDSWHPDFLDRTVKLMEESDEAGVVVRTDKVIEEINEDSSEVRVLKLSQWMPEVKVINLYKQCIDNQMTPITFIYRRSVFDEIGYYDESLPVVGDWDFGIRFLQKYDVEYLDPGFALANYHHRKPRPGDLNNSYSSKDKHRYYTNKLMNKYLREELNDGRMGVGYIMSKLKYDQSFISGTARKLLPSFIVNLLKRRTSN